MKIKPHVCNIAVITTGDRKGCRCYILLGHKPPKNSQDARRKRNPIGRGKWVPPGGGTKRRDKSQKHAVQREIREETELFFPLSSFRKVGILRSYVDRNLTTLKRIVHLYSVTTAIDPRIPVHFERSEYDAMSWFPLSRIPWSNMISGDRKWLPAILNDEKVFVKIVFDRHKENVEFILVEHVCSGDFVI